MVTLSELQSYLYTYLQSEDDIQQIATDFNAGEITGAVVKMGDGEYSEVWVTDSSRPFELKAEYRKI